MKTGKIKIVAFTFIVLFTIQCKKQSKSPPPVPVPTKFTLLSFEINNQSITQNGRFHFNIPVNTPIKLVFNKKVDKSTLGTNAFISSYGTNIQATFSYEKNDSTVIIKPDNPLFHLNKYSVNVIDLIKAADNTKLDQSYAVHFTTSIDSTAKFPVISDDSLLTLVQKQTFKYFWDYGHPVSGLARERSNDGPETITSGGSGFGIMAIPVAINRGFITRSQGLQRMQTIVNFLKTKAQTFHGAFPHWLNGTTGVAIAFSPKDNGADLVETSYLMAGLLSARQYFNAANTDETNLHNDINSLWNAVEWNWFRQNNQNALYWHWSPNYNWDMNMKIQGWNECLITYILAASSSTYGIPKNVYTEGYARNGAMANNGTYYGYQLPLGPAYGGPLFWSHYSFLGINPNSLTDVYADYQKQVTNHTKINFEYCKSNPKNFFSYSNQCWGLTASDIPNGYNANEPANDIGVISPTAALSSFPYTPNESMAALKFFYYTLGDKIWKDYGFVDAFSLKDLWYANSFLAIDQGPVIVMIENYRSGLVWSLLTSCPEIKSGMKSLGFSAPYLN